MIEVEGPDGAILEFPDGTSPETMKAAMAKRYGAPKAAPTQAKPKRKLNLYEELIGPLANANAQIPLGDELVAAGNTVLNATRDAVAGKEGPGWVNRFKGEMARQRQFEAQYAEARPKAAALSRGTGMAATAAIPVGPTVNMFSSAPRAVNAARGAVTAGLTAAGYAAADRGTARERLAAASGAATNPVVLGLGAAGGAMAPAARGKPKPGRPGRMSPKDTTARLQAEKTAAYRAADESGAQYTAEAFDGMVDSVDAAASAARINPMRHPKAASMLEDLRGLKGQSPSLTELDQIRQVVRRDVVNSKDDAERFFGNLIIEQIDEFLGGAQAAQMAGGNADEAAALIRAARDANTRFRKVEKVSDGLERARRMAGKSGTGGNIDNSIRTEMNRVLEKTPNLTDQERAALDEIIVGGKAQNILRQVGRLSPTGNGLMLAGHIGAAGMTGGTSAVVSGVGAGAKIAADQMTQRKVAELIQLMAEGGSPQVRAQALAEFSDLAASNPAVAQLQKELAARLSRGAGIVAAPREAPPNLYAQP